MGKTKIELNMKYFILLLCILSFNLWASEDPNCSNSPKDAVLIIPEPINKWAKVICSKYGHIATYTQDFGWFSHKSKKLRSFGAQLAKGSPLVGSHGYYFTDISVEKYSEAIGKVMVDIYMPEIYFSFFGMDIPQEIPEAYMLSFTNNEKQELGIIFFIYKKYAFGTACWDACSPINGFAIIERPKNF